VENKSYKVLVVEDEGLIALDISKRLEALGHQVVAAVGNSKEALENACGADIVLMDVRIDGPVDGIDTAARIREQFHLPVIFLTAHGDRATIERAKVTGPFGYIVKPIAHASLNSTIEITVYKHKLERELEEREALLRTTLGSVADAVVVTDHLSRVLMLNEAAENLTGWTHPEAEGQPVLRVLRLVDVESGELAEDPVPLVILRDAVLPFDRSWQLVSRGGRQMMIEGSAVPVKVSGIALGTVITFRDVSVRLWEEKQLRQAQKVDAAGRMAARVSDEYSSLLAIIRNQSEQLLRQFGEYSPARQSIEEIQEAAAAAEALTRRLTRFGTRQATGQPELLSVNGMLRRMSKLIESVAGARIELALRPSPAAGKVRADAAQLEQAIMNLVLHACARMPEGGKLVIETGNTDLPRLASVVSYVTLTIAHTGEEPDVEKLFEPASIAEDGLALAMVHGVVAEHGGYISAQPVANGCRFEMLLPRVIEAQLPEADVEPRGVPSLLLVDYRERVRAQLHNFFEAEGYNLLEAVDDQEALALGEVHEGSLDLLVAEAADADRITAALRKTHPRLQVLRIVDQLESACNEIQRPFTQAALLDKAAQLLENRKAAATSSSV
jgi:two-component system cell cycle sensor histidine kinase/response regulator CckA